MKSGRKWAVIRDCLKKNRMALLLWGLMLLTELAVFTLYDIMLEPLIYAGALTLFAGLVLLRALMAVITLSDVWKLVH